MASSPTYCTHKELKRVFPQIDEFDGKKTIYNWILDQANVSGTYDMYYAYDTGLITQLYKDGNEIATSAFTTATKTTLTSDAPTAATGIALSTTGMAANDYVRINDEVMRLTTITDGSNAAVSRGALGTTPQAHDSGDAVKLIFDSSSTTGTEAFYESDFDLVALTVTTTPEDNLIEAGEDFVGLVTQYRADASRLLDSFLDPNLPKNQLKNKAGDYDYLIVRSAALICASLMIKTSDPTSEMANAYMEEALGYVDKLNNGELALSHQNTADSSKGIIRDVLYVDGSVRPVDTRGHYSGTFDLIRVTIETGGAMDGTAKYSVWVKDGDKLGIHQGNQVVTNEIINGDYQALAGGLQIRFAGDTKTSVATSGNEWEIEVMGWSEEVDSSSLKPIRMTRKWQ